MLVKVVSKVILVIYLRSQESMSVKRVMLNTTELGFSIILVSIQRSLKLLWLGNVVIA